MILFTPEEWEAMKGSSGKLEIPEEIEPLTPEEEEELNDFFLMRLMEIFSKPVEED